MTTIRIVSSTDTDPAGEALTRVVERRGREANFYAMYANSPHTLDAVCELVWTLWEAKVVERATIELTILRVSQLLGAEYEWVHHRQMALDAGVRPDQLAQLDHWPDADVFDARERALLAVVDAAVTGLTVPADRLAELHRRFTDAEAVDLFTVIGLYRAIGQMLVGFGVPVEPWAAPAGDEWTSFLRSRGETR